MMAETSDRYPPVVSRREAARRLGMSTWTLNKYSHELEIVTQHGVNMAGERFTRDMIALDSVERLQVKLAATHRAA
jgi:hypothetical protein